MLIKDVVIVGLLNKFEIWDKQKWSVEFQENKKKFTDISRFLKMRA